MKLIKENLKWVISVLYIIANFLFYKTIFNDFSNMYLLVIGLILLITEVPFWYVLLKDLLNSERIKLKNKEQQIIKSLIIFGMLILGITRAILHGSPYYNDLVNTNIYMLYFVGITRVLVIFNSILFIFLSIDSKKINYILISVLNLVVSIMIWLDFDMNITSILRILISILYILTLFVRKEGNNEVLE